MKYANNPIELLEAIRRGFEKSGDYSCYMFDGGLLDSYIFTNVYITYVLKEVYLNEWSSDYDCRHFNRLPQKYKKIIELLDNGEEEKARKLFYKD